MIDCMVCPVRNVCSIFQKHRIKISKSGAEAMPYSIDSNAEGKEIPGNYALCPLYQLVKN